MTAGVYAIENTANDRVCVGSSRNIERRWNTWKSVLSGHPEKVNQDFYRDWADLGPTAFTLRVLETPPPDRAALAEAETRWIDRFGARCYNVLVTAYKSRRGHQQEDSFYPAIGERIMLARRHAGLSQRTLARRLGVTHAAISDIERAKTHPHLDNLAVIAEALGVPLSEIVVLERRQPVPVRRVE